MRKALGCTLLSATLVGGLALPAAALPTTDGATGTGGATLQAMSISPTAAARLRPALRVGARTPAVVYVQRKLGVRPASGYYGAITKRAVTALQRKEGLRTTGTVDRPTWRVLLAAKGGIALPAADVAQPPAGPADPATSTPPATPATPAAPGVPATPATPATPAAPAAPATPATPAPTGPSALTPEQAAAARPTLRQGTGPGDPAVVFVQQFLQVSPTSGFFGQRTRSAVTAYQKALAIKATGVVGPKTWQAILSGTRPAPAPATPPTVTDEAVATPVAPPAPPAPPAPAAPAPPAPKASTIPTPTYQLPATPAARDLALVFALAQVGKPYVLGANGPAAFDCSSLVQQGYLAAGVKLPRLASQQRFAGTQVSLEELLPGDLLYYQDGASPRRGHISMYAGNGLVVEAANPRRGVRMRLLQEAWYRDRFVAAVRIG